MKDRPWILSPHLEIHATAADLGPLRTHIHIVPNRSSPWTRNNAQEAQRLLSNQHPLSNQFRADQALVETLRYPILAKNIVGDRRQPAHHPRDPLGPAEMHRCPTLDPRRFDNDHVDALHQLQVTHLTRISKKLLPCTNEVVRYWPWPLCHHLTKVPPLSLPRHQCSTVARPPSMATMDVDTISVCLHTPPLRHFPLNEKTRALLPSLSRRRTGPPRKREDRSTQRSTGPTRAFAGCGKR